MSDSFGLISYIDPSLRWVFLNYYAVHIFTVSSRTFCWFSGNTNGHWFVLIAYWVRRSMALARITREMSPMNPLPTSN